MRLELFALGDIAGIHHHPFDVGILCQVARQSFQDAPRAILVPKSQFFPGQRYGLPEAGGKDGPDPRRILGMNQVEEISIEEFLQGVAQNPLHGGALVSNRAIGVDHRNDIRCVLDQRPKILLPLKEGRLRPFALGDVAHDPDDPNNLTLGIAQRAGLIRGPEAGSGAADAELEFGGATLPVQGHLQRTKHTAFAQKRKDLGRLLPQHLAGGVASKTFHIGIPDLVVQVVVIDDDALLRAGDDLLVEPVGFPQSLFGANALVFIFNVLEGQRQVPSQLAQQLDLFLDKGFRALRIDR